MITITKTCAQTYVVGASDSTIAANRIFTIVFIIHLAFVVAKIQISEQNTKRKRKFLLYMLSNLLSKLLPKLGSNCILLLFNRLLSNCSTTCGVKSRVCAQRTEYSFLVSRVWLM